MEKSSAKNDLPAPVRTAAQELLIWLETEQVPQVIIGGFAAALVGMPRSTNDVDAVVLFDTDKLESFVQKAALYGFVPRYSDSLEFARAKRVLLLQHQTTGVGVDISFGAMPFEEEMIDRALTVTVDSINFKVATPEDLIVMKVLARRSRDIADIEALLNINPQLDFDRVRYWVREFAAVMEMPEIMEELEKLLPNPKPTSSKRRKR